MSYNPNNPNGAAVTANSQPVNIASDQTVPVSAASLPLPSGAATSAAQGTGNTSVASIDTKTPALGQALAAASVPVVLTAAQIATLTPPPAITGFALDATLGTTNTEIGGLTETAPATDTASSGLNGRLQRIAQRLTTLIGSTIAVSGTFWQATQPVSIATAPVLVAGSAIIGKVGIDQTTPGTTNGVQVNAALPTGTNTIGNTGAIAVSTGGYSKVKYAAQTTSVQTVKGTQGKLGGYVIYNPNATVAYVQLFDVASGTTVTLGTTVPDVILPIPATAGANLLDSTGVDFTNGIKLACTTTATGLTAPGTGLDMSIFYK